MRVVGISEWKAAAKMFGMLGVVVLGASNASGQNLTQQIDSLIGEGVLAQVWSEDLEDLSFDDSGVCSGNCPEVIDSPEGAFMRATLCGTMPTTYRTEFQVVNKADIWLDQGPYLITFKVRFNPTGPATLEKRSMFMQLHTVNVNEDLSLPRWQPIGGRVTAEPGAGFWECERLDNEYHAEHFNYEDNVWYEMVILVFLTERSKGQITCYRNGELEFQAQEANSGQWRFPLHHKFGVYSGSNQIGSPNYSEGCRTIDFDDMRVVRLSNEIIVEPNGCQRVHPFDVTELLNLN